MAEQPPSGQWSAPPRPTSGAGAVVAAALAGVAIVGAAWFWQAGGWIFDQIILQLELPVPGWTWPLSAVFAAGLLAVPGLLLWRIPRSAAVRESGRVWLFAAIAGALGTILRAIPDAYAEAYLGCLAVVYAALALALRRRRACGAQRSPVAIALAMIGGIVVLVPWLIAGALGGSLETALAVLAAAAAGWLVTSIMDGRFWAPFLLRRRVRRVLVGGLVSGVALLLIAAGLGESGTQLTAMLVLAPLGFAAAALAPGSPAAAGWLAGLAALGPLAFVDSQELSLFLLGREIPFWIGLAAVGSLVIALLLGAALVVVHPPLLGVPVPGRPPAPGHIPDLSLARPGSAGSVFAGVAFGVVVAVALGAGAVYTLAGQPGLHGEQLFVVMKQQASLAGLPQTVGSVGRDERVAAVYQRLTSFANASQSDLRKQLDRWNLHYTPYYLVNGVLVDGGPLVRAWLSNRSDVDRVLLDPVLRPLPEMVKPEHGDRTAPPEPVGWNVRMVGAAQIWSRGFSGQGIVIGSSDSGVDGTHPALRQNYRGGNDSWYDPWYGSTQPTDYSGHGTHTVGTAVGRDGIGVAPDAQWVGCVNLARNLGSPSHYLDCLQFMLAPFPRGGNPFTDGNPSRAPHILTNSWSCPVIEGCDAGALRPATAALAAAGIAVVVAAGNSGPRCDSIVDPPATYSSVITVAAVNEERQVAQFSSRGPSPSGKPDIAAPGEQVISALPENTYGALSGTSMATPHVAGLIALLWSQRPELIGDLASTRGLLAAAAVPARDVSTGCGGAEGQVGAGIAQAVEIPS